mgnify:CR=1 FL=1
MNYYCEISIIDNATKKKRKCKNLFKFDILGKKCCTIHLNSFYIKYIVKIQKVFRAFNLRKKLKYFKLLPNDLQHKIIIYSRDSFYENKRNKKIAEIILNKIDIFIKKYFNFRQQKNYLLGAIQFYNFQLNNFQIMEFSILNTHPNANYLVNHVLYLFYLLDKYQPIIVKQKIFYTYIYRERIGYDISSMFVKFLILQENILKYRNQIKNIENYKYISSVFNFGELYSN